MTLAKKVIREWPALTWTPPVPVPCQDNPDLFFPDNMRGGWDHRPATRLCHTCPVMSDCLTWALTDERPGMGVWGGVHFVDGRPAGRVIA